MSSVFAPSSLPLRRTSRRRARPRVAGALQLAPLVVLHLVVCAVAQPGSEPVRDEPALLAAAERLIHDGQLAASGPDPDQRAWLWHGPGLIVVLAPLVALDLPLGALRFLSPVLLGATVVIFHRLLRERLAPRPALLWTYALGLYVPAFFVLGTLQKEPLAMLLVVSAMLAVTRALRGGRPLATLAAGLALAGLAMVRLEYGWVAIALLAIAAAWWLPRPRDRATGRRAAAIAAVAVLGCVPWLAYTYSLTGKPLYWSASSGLSLFWMSPTLPGETGQWHSPVHVFRDPSYAEYRPLFRRLDRVHPFQSDLELRRRALENIRERPGRYALNLVANASRLLFHEPMTSHRPAIRVVVHVLFNAPLAVAVLWAASALWRRRRRLPPEAVPFAIFAALAIGIHLPPSASPRMLLPVVPVLLWLIATAVAVRSQPVGPGPSP